MPRTEKNARNTATAPGISAKGNALRSIVVWSLVVALTPIALGLAYLLFLREPALQQAQIERVSAAYATQQSVNVKQMISLLGQRMQGAAKSPLALSAIGGGSEQNLSLIEQTMLDYFPEVISLRILPIGEMGTAGFEGGNQGLRNHIEVDLVRRTSIGEETLPEAYQFESRWLTSLAYLISHPRIQESKAVIIATIDNQLLVDELNALDPTLGRSILHQFFTTSTGRERVVDVAVAGTAETDEYTQLAPIEQTNWRLGFTPSQALLDKLAVDTMPVWLISVLSMLAAIAAATMVLLLSRRSLLSEIDRVISAADSKTPLVLEVPELVSVAKQLRRATVKSLRKGGGSKAGVASPPEVSYTPSSELTNPLFQPTNMIDEVDEVLELDLPEELPIEKEVESGLPDHIFRAYDIRGIAKTELTDELVARIGGAIGSVAIDLDQQAIIVASDGRDSSPRIKAGLIRSLMESGRDVIDIGTVPTPLLYFATRHLNAKSGVMVTGSHNQAQDNGFKIVFNEQTLAAGGIQTIRERVIEGDFTTGQGRTIKEDIVPAYIDEVVGDIAIAVPLKIVIDAGNGVTGLLAPRLFEELGCEVVPLYCDIDGRFPNHPPDTSNEANLADLVAVVEHEQADFGVAFDGDGDRLAVVTSSGKIVRSDVLLMIYAQDVVSRNPGADVVFDVKCSRDLSHLITRFGGRPVLWKTGHAFMKEKMAETGALLGGEFSGHMFFGERWYGFDDGMYAAGRLAEILSTNGVSLDETLADLPSSVSTPEIIVPVEESNKFSIMDAIVKNCEFPDGKINTLDGIRVDYKDGWGLLRASNTSAALTARFEASDESTLEVVKQDFKAQIALAQPELDLPF
ncbi:MAG: phosphomannomutase/phosphoglucomutase [Halioglobus sp.]